MSQWRSIASVEGGNMAADARRSESARSWTAKDWIQGRPIHRPTHPILVIFPIAFISGALLLDLLSRTGLVGGPLAATYAVAGAVIGAALAVLTGSLERSDMRPGTRIRRVATRHMIIQLTASAIFVIDLAVRWGGRHQAKADILWIVVDILAVAIVIVGGDVGGQMVFRMGYRVGTDTPPGVEGGEPTGGAQA
jgi:uncharacterized membrane protein